MNNYKIIGYSAIFIYVTYYFFTRASWHFIDSVNLLIHEAGHLLFSPFGWTLTILGGSLLQLIVPIVFSGYFLLRKQLFSTAVMIAWTAINFFNVSVYAGDALKMQLPLLTGDTDTHDWNQLLFKFGLLHHTDIIAGVIFTIGILCALSIFILAYFDLRAQATLGKIQE